MPRSNVVGFLALLGMTRVTYVNDSDLSFRWRSQRNPSNHFKPSDASE